MRKRVLIADDEVHVRKVIDFKLKSHGYQVFQASNGADGLNIIQKEKPNVVITDINMPIIDGKSLCEKTNPLKKENPFLTIIITARILPEEEDWIRNMDDTQFMEKPFSPTKLLAAVDSYIHASLSSAPECRQYDTPAVPIQS